MRISGNFEKSLLLLAQVLTVKRCAHEKMLITCVTSSALI